MHHIELTPEIEARVRANLLARDKNEAGYNTYTVKVYRSGELNATDDPCAASLGNVWQTSPDAYSDIVGIAYGGYGERDRLYSRGYGDKALQYLTAVMTCKAYSGLHPYLVDTDPEKILAAKGFIFHNLSAPEFNMGLFFTFMVAQRQAYENRTRMPVFLHAAEKYPLDIALFISHILEPRDVEYTSWARKLGVHGDPFGTWPAQVLIKRFLSGDTRLIKNKSAIGAQGCFSDEAYKYNYEKHQASMIPPQSLDTWVQSFENERESNEAAIAA